MNNFNLHNPTHIAFGKGTISELRALIPADSRVLVKKPACSIRSTAP